MCHVFVDYYKVHWKFKIERTEEKNHLLEKNEKL